MRSGKKSPNTSDSEDKPEYESHAQLPQWYAELYELIGQNNTFDINLAKSMINDAAFDLLRDPEGNELPVPAEAFEQFHDHCFETPLLALSHVASQHHIASTDDDLAEMINTLISLGADVNARDEENNTPILLLANSVPHRAHLMQSILTLTGNGADLHAVNDEGKNALHRAFELGNFSLATELLHSGVQVIQDYEGRTFLLEADQIDMAEIAKYADDLIEHLQLHDLLDEQSEPDDTLFHLLSIANKKNPIFPNIQDDIIEYCKKNNTITERALRFMLEHQMDEDIFQAVFTALDRKLKSNLKLESGLENAAKRNTPSDEMPAVGPSSFSTTTTSWFGSPQSNIFKSVPSENSGPPSKKSRVTTNQSDFGGSPSKDHYKNKNEEEYDSNDDLDSNQP